MFSRINVIAHHTNYIKYLENCSYISWASNEILPVGKCAGLHKASETLLLLTPAPERVRCGGSPTVGAVTSCGCRPPPQPRGNMGQEKSSTAPTLPTGKAPGEAPLPKGRASHVSQEKHTLPHTSLNIYRLCSLIKLVLVGKLKATLNSLTKQLGFYASKTREFSSFPSKALKNSLFSYKKSFSICENQEGSRLVVNVDLNIACEPGLQLRNQLYQNFI